MRDQLTERTGLTAEQRRQRARIAALARWAKENPAENAARGQAGLVAKFLAEVDSESPGLPEPERQRRAEVKRRLHMERLSFLATKARRRTPDDREAA